MSRASQMSAAVTLLMRRYEDIDVRERMAVLLAHVIMRAIRLDITKHELLAVVEASYEEATGCEYRKVGDA